MKLIAAAFLALLSACQSPAGTPSAHKTDSVVPATTLVKAPPDSTTLGGEWFLQPVLPSDTAAGKTPTLQLDLGKSRFSGNTGCNSMHGQFWYGNTDSSLSFGDKINMTRMACPGYNEPAFLKSLKNVSHYRLQNGVLTLLSDDRTELSRWMRKRATAPKALKA
ncbi:MAG TPA: META domain-containing protein [Puia sp.]|nr:META domain-containing protein [Puia sp.]